jgi:broad specificity phosphatase PhoE
MSVIYLIRHGQADQFDEDTLTELGRTQSRLLGSYLAERKVSFRAVYSGALTRQLQTAEEFRDAFGGDRLPRPKIIVEPGWNELDLALLYSEIAPRLTEDDRDFKTAYDRMLYLKANPSDELVSAISTCHMSIICAWMAGRYPFSGQAWPDFLSRLTETLDEFRRHQRDDAIAVFTSIVPIAVCVGIAGVGTRQMLTIGRELHHTGFTVLDISDGRIHLQSLNELPHLTRPEMRTLL